MENNTVQKFLNDMFGEVRTVIKDSEIWFVASDITKVLQYRDNTDLTRGLDDDEKDTESLCTLGGVQKTLIINESGLYNAVLSITKRNKERYDKARQFKKWITKTVIPSIRKDGGYIDGEEKVVTGEMSEEELIQKALHVMDAKIKRLEEEKSISEEARLVAENKVEQLTPIASLADTFLNTGDCYDIGTYTKILEMKNFGRTKMFAWLKENKILMETNIPYQGYAQYFKVITTVKNGHTYNKTLLRPVGVKYIYKKLIKDGKIIEKPLEDIIKDIQEIA